MKTQPVHVWYLYVAYFVAMNGSSYTHLMIISNQMVSMCFLLGTTFLAILKIKIMILAGCCVHPNQEFMLGNGKFENVDIIDHDWYCKRYEPTIFIVLGHNVPFVHAMHWTTWISRQKNKLKHINCGLFLIYEFTTLNYNDVRQKIFKNIRGMFGDIDITLINTGKIRGYMDNSENIMSLSLSPVTVTR